MGFCRMAFGRNTCTCDLVGTSERFMVLVMVSFENCQANELLRS